MSKRLLSRLSGVLFAVLASGAFAGTAGNGDQTQIRGLNHANRVQGSYIVVYKEGAQVNRQTAMQTAMDHGGNVQHVYNRVLNGFSAQMTEKAARKLANNPNVAYVEADRRVSINATQSNPPSWGLDRSDQRDLPMDDAYNYNFDGTGVHAYVVDTGINASHNDFGGRVTLDFSSINDGNGASDCNGHGTHVAGTVGGSSYGIAKNVQLHAVRVLGCDGSGTNSGVIDGVDYVAQNAQMPAVANMSLGGGASSALDDAVNNAVAQGVTFVVAAGNSDADACNSSPARASDVFTVGSTTSSDSRSSFSNWGSCVDIFAPGSNITSAWYNSDTATNTISGTSMASPHVAGAAALILDEDSSRSPSQVMQLLVDRSTTNVVSDPNGSPNRLLYTLGGDGGGGGGGGDTVLENGVPVTDLSGAQGSETYFTMDVPSGASDLTFAMSGGSGDADLYVKFGSQPTTSSYDCRPYQYGNDETCSFASPSAGTWHVMIRGYNSYSGVTLEGSYTTDGGGGGGSSCPSGYEKYTGTLSDGGYEYQPDGNYYYSGSGTQSGELSGPSSADFDLKLWKWNGSSWSTVDSSTSADSQESVSYNGSSGYYVWRIESYSGSGDYLFCMDRP